MTANWERGVLRYFNKLLPKPVDCKEKTSFPLKKKEKKMSAPFFVHLLMQKHGVQRNKEDFPLIFHFL